MTLLVVAAAAAEEYITARDLLAPEMFPEASFGMAVETVEDGAVAQVTRPGASSVSAKSLTQSNAINEFPRGVRLQH